jgi:transposase
MEQQVLLHCTPYPSPWSIIILDNAVIHKPARLSNLCKEHGVRLLFLLLYLLDYNPIETTFKDLKV